MLPRISIALCVLLLAPSVAWSQAATEARPSGHNACLLCHADRQSGFSSKHAFAINSCSTCHAGDDRATTVESAHTGLVAFPGNLDNALTTCGQCHAERTAGLITGNLMHTGHGMVRITRQIVDGSPGLAGTANLQSLGDSIADSMLRKLCAGCHLGQPKTEHGHDVMFDRGGGCLACHVNEYPENGHPKLTTLVSDARCFGCHARSGRISLSYTGLAESGESVTVTSGLRLPDGRHVERMPADVHYLAGLSCTDCHKAGDLMGDHAAATNQRDAVEARCTDCHDVTGTTYGHDKDHERLTCAACHTQWAPQCIGCHMEFDADGEQWDHADREVTSGRWREERWGVRNALPTLGVNEAGQIDVFIPGMIMTVAHPDFETDKFVRIFGALSPHTIGPARSCESCHRSSIALGLGSGTVDLVDGGPVFRSTGRTLQDGLPEDAWTNIDNSLGGRAPLPGQRPLSAEEMRKILGADIELPDTAPGR